MYGGGFKDKREGNETAFLLHFLARLHIIRLIKYPMGVYRKDAYGRKRMRVPS